jgi:hypothetical protein
MYQEPVVRRGTRFVSGDQTLEVQAILKDGVKFTNGYLASFSEVEEWLKLAAASA